MTTAVPILERGLTAVALNDYIKSEPRIAELDGTLAAGVDGDLLTEGCCMGCIVYGAV